MTRRTQSRLLHSGIHPGLKPIKSRIHLPGLSNTVIWWILQEVEQADGAIAEDSYKNNIYLEQSQYFEPGQRWAATKNSSCPSVPQPKFQHSKPDRSS